MASRNLGYADCKDKALRLAVKGKVDAVAGKAGVVEAGSDGEQAGAAAPDGEAAQGRVSMAATSRPRGSPTCQFVAHTAWISGVPGLTRPLT